MMHDDVVAVPVEVEHTATVPVEAVVDQPEEIPLDPNRLIEADVAIARTEADTEQARIAARTAVKIAEIQAEEPSWLNDFRECLTRLEMKVEVIENHLSSTPPVSTVIVTEPEAPTIVETPEPVAEESPEVTPELNEAPEEAAPAVRQKRRWI